MKTSIILSILTLMVLGSAGIYRTLSLFKISTLSRIIISISFPFLNYLLMNWLVRGAMTEFFAMCILPWFLYWNINFVKNKIFSYWIIPIMFLIYLGHVIMVYYSGFVLMISCLIFYFYNKNNTALLFQIIKKSFFSVLIFFILVSPYIICSRVFLNKNGYNIGPSLSFIKAGHYSPLKTYQKLNKYFLDLDFYKILTQQHRLSFQINLAISILILSLILIVLIQKYVQKKLTFDPRILFKKCDATLIFLIMSLVFFLYLMSSRISVWFYKFIPGADFVQFSFRFLAFVSILNLILIGYLFSVINKNTKTNKLTNILLSFYLLVILIAYPGFREFSPEYYRYSRSQMENENNNNFPIGIGEYSPQSKELGKLKEINEWSNYFAKDYNKKIIKLTNQKQPCSFNIRYNDVGKATIKYLVNCSESALIQLPIHYSGYESISKIEKNSYTKIEDYYRTKDSPFIHIHLLKGQYELELKMPTMGRVFNKMLSKNEK